MRKYLILSLLLATPAFADPAPLTTIQQAQLTQAQDRLAMDQAQFTVTAARDAAKVAQDQALPTSTVNTAQIAADQARAAYDAATAAVTAAQDNVAIGNIHN